MQSRSIIQAVLSVTLALGLSACSHNARQVGDQGTSYKYKQDGIVKTQGMGNSVRFAGSDQRDLLSKDTVYFGYDCANISEDELLLVQAHADYLRENRQCHIRIEGHTDERGSSRYNIALGERRALAVKKVLISEGVSPKQISIVSYGKEKPVDEGHHEGAYCLNRRAVIVYERN